MDELQLALKIMSGRNQSECIVDNLSNAEIDLLGYDPWKFSYYGKPSNEEVLYRAEQIVHEHIVSKKDVIIRKKGVIR